MMEYFIRSFHIKRRIEVSHNSTQVWYLYYEDRDCLNCQRWASKLHIHVFLSK